MIVGYLTQRVVFAKMRCLGFARHDGQFVDKKGRKGCAASPHNLSFLLSWHSVMSSATKWSRDIFNWT